MAEIGGSLYTLLRVLHVLGAMIFLGSLVFATWWKLGADRSGDPKLAAHVHRRLRKADAQWVAPAAIVTFAAGYAMVRFFGSRIAKQPVALWGLILMFTALAFWYFGMRRLGDQLADEADASAAQGQPLSRDYGRRSVAWLACAVLAAALVAFVAVLMMLRPPMR